MIHFWIIFHPLATGYSGYAGYSGYRLPGLVLYPSAGYWLQRLQRLRWLQPEPPEKTGASTPEGLE